MSEHVFLCRLAGTDHSLVPYLAESAAQAAEAFMADHMLNARMLGRVQVVVEHRYSRVYAVDRSWAYKATPCSATEAYKPEPE